MALRRIERKIGIADSAPFFRRPECQHVHRFQLGAMHVRGVQLEHGNQLDASFIVFLASN